jgi:hypothetical protein
MFTLVGSCHFAELSLILIVPYLPNHLSWIAGPALNLICQFTHCKGIADANVIPHDHQEIVTYQKAVPS